MDISTAHCAPCAQSYFFVTPWTVPHQAPLSMEFPKNTGVGYHFLLQGIFLTWGSNPGLLCLLHWQADFFTSSARQSWLAQGIVLNTL